MFYSAKVHRPAARSRPVEGRQPLFWGTFLAALRAPYGVKAMPSEYAIETDLTLSSVVSRGFDGVAQRDTRAKRRLGT